MNCTLLSLNWCHPVFRCDLEPKLSFVGWRFCSVPVVSGLCSIWCPFMPNCIVFLSLFIWVLLCLPTNQNVGIYWKWKFHHAWAQFRPLFLASLQLLSPHPYSNTQDSDIAIKLSAVLAQTLDAFLIWFQQWFSFTFYFHWDLDMMEKVITTTKNTKVCRGNNSTQLV